MQRTRLSEILLSYTVADLVAGISPEGAAELLAIGRKHMNQNRLVELLVEMCLRGDVDETPVPDCLLPDCDQVEWWNGMEPEEATRISIAASILALSGQAKMGGSIFSGDQELSALLRQD